MESRGISLTNTTALTEVNSSELFLFCDDLIPKVNRLKFDFDLIFRNFKKYIMRFPYCDLLLLYF